MRHRRHYTSLGVVLLPGWLYWPLSARLDRSCLNGSVVWCWRRRVDGWPDSSDGFLACVSLYWPRFGGPSIEASRGDRGRGLTRLVRILVALEATDLPLLLIQTTISQCSVPSWTMRRHVSKGQRKPRRHAVVRQSALPGSALILVAPTLERGDAAVVVPTSASAICRPLVPLRFASA